MTIRELYEQAVREGCENYDIVIQGYGESSPISDSERRDDTKEFLLYM